MGNNCEKLFIFIFLYTYCFQTRLQYMLVLTKYFTNIALYVKLTVFSLEINVMRIFSAFDVIIMEKFQCLICEYFLDMILIIIIVVDIMLFLTCIAKHAQKLPIILLIIHSFIMCLINIRILQIGKCFGRNALN